MRECQALALNGLGGQDFALCPWLLNADLRGANLRFAKLDYALLTNSLLDGADMTGASLLDVSAENASFNFANLVEAKLDGAYLKSASFVDANLQGEQCCRRCRRPRTDKETNTPSSTTQGPRCSRPYCRTPRFCVPT